MIAIGVGFLAVGIMFMLLADESNLASAQDFSAVPMEVNFPAPELNLTNASGDAVSLADYKGSVVLVNLWATWCPPCREEMPTLSDFYDKYRSRGFILLGVDQGETTNQVNSFIEEFALDFPIWLDPGSEAGSAFKTMNLPSSYVIDRDGNVRLMWIGGISKKNLEKYVPNVIKE